MEFFYYACAYNVPIWKFNMVTREPSKHTNFDISCVYWSHYGDTEVNKWLGKYTLYKQDLKNSSVYNVCCIFDAKCIFVYDFGTSFRPYQPIPWNCNDKSYGAKGPKAEKNKYPIL